jgi:predicted dehydrogenase
MTFRRPLTAAIIGTGRIAGDYDRQRRAGEKGIYTHAGAFRAQGRIRLQTVYDQNTPKAVAFARRWQATAVSSLHSIVNTYHDIVSVCTPDHTHYRIVRALLEHRSCRVIFVEKPAARTSREISQLMALAHKYRMDVVVNFQRHFEPEHLKLAALCRQSPSHVLTAQGIYVKGLDHNGVTMIDTLRLLFGRPRAVLALGRIYNRQMAEYSYDFVLFYSGFSVTVRTADSAGGQYNYHVFEIDVLFQDKRIASVDNSRFMREVSKISFGYSGVKGLDDARPRFTPTGYSLSMIRVVDYLHKICVGEQKLTENTLASSRENAWITEAVKASFRKGLKKVILSWQ